MKTYELSAIAFDLEVTLVEDCAESEPFICIEQADNLGYGGAVKVPLSGLAAFLHPGDDEDDAASKARLVSALRELAGRIERGEGVNEY